MSHVHVLIERYETVGALTVHMLNLRRRALVWWLENVRQITFVLAKTTARSQFYLPRKVQHSDINEHPLSPRHEQSQMYEYYYRRAARHQVPGPRRCRQPVPVPTAI